jgi:hypothetical protein
MIDTIGELLFWGSFVLPPLVLTAAVIKLRRFSLVRRFSAAVLIAVGVFIILTFTWTGICFRDGLGPDMIESHGLEAVHKSLPDIMLGCVSGGILMGLACFVLQYKNRNETMPGNQL